MAEQKMSAAELARRLVMFREQDPDDRKAYANATRSVMRWRHPESQFIRDPEEAAFVARELGLSEEQLPSSDARTRPQLEATAEQLLRTGQALETALETLVSLLEEQRTVVARLEAASGGG